MEAAAPKAQIEIHEKVRELLATALSLPQGATALDAAAGNGYMSAWLLRQGFDVTPLDIAPAECRVAPCRYSDFNKRLEVDDGAFDLVVSIETIEHLENPFLFVRELGRVTRPGGLVVVTTPNVHAIRSRLKYLVCGLPTLFEYLQDDGMGQHISPISMGTFLYAFEMADLELVDVFSTGPKPAVALRPLFHLVNLATLAGTAALKFKRRARSDHYVTRLGLRQLWELNRDVSLIVVARKSQAQRRPRAVAVEAVGRAQAS